MKYFFKNMFAVSIVLIFCANIAYAKIITCSNNPNSPGMTTNLQFACDSLASSGDTILISGSSTSYGNITLKKSLTLLGTGANPQKDFALYSIVDNIYIQADNCDIEGLKCYFIGCNSGFSPSNTKIVRNVMDQLNSCSNSWLIANNIIRSFYISSGSNTIVMNNIFNGQMNNSYLGITNVTNIIFSHNTIIGGYGNFNNCLVADNIFYAVGSNSGKINGSGTYSIFNNNVVYNYTDSDPFSISNGNFNTESNNFYGSNPMFTNFLQNPYDIFNSNLQLQPTSPFIAAGTDKTEIGAYGGTFPLQASPFTGNPAIPQLQKMDIKKLVIAPGDSLNVNIKAKGFK